MCLKRLSRAPAHEDSEHWVPYPLCRLSPPAYFSQYFDESCTLSEIASKISRHLFEDDDNLAKISQLRETLSSLYGDLKCWHDKLPNVFDPSDTPAPHILLLQCVYSKCMFLIDH